MTEKIQATPDWLAQIYSHFRPKSFIMNIPEGEITKAANSIKEMANEQEQK